FNLGTGTGYSVAEVVETVSAVCGRPVKTRPAPRRPGDPPTLVAAPGRAAAELGWRPRLSDLSTIARHAAAWEAQGRRPKPPAPLLARLLFRALLVLVPLAPLPFGSNRPWSWSLLALRAGRLRLGWAAAAARGRAPAPVPLRKAWPVVLPFGLACAWAALQA